MAVAFTLSKRGLAGGFEPLSGGLMRLLVATATIWLFTVVRGEVLSDLRRVREHPRALSTVALGATFGPVLAAWLVLVSLERTPVGITHTLANLGPIFMIPIGYLVFKERITHRAVFGTVVAVTRTAILFL